METRVIIVHGWGGSANEGWFPWLAEKLRKESINALALQMPDTEEPHIEAWVGAIGRAVGSADEHCVFVGHSLGCQAIVRYVASLGGSAKVRGAVFVAGFFLPITNLWGGEKEVLIDREWAETKVDFGRAREKLRESIAIFSTDDDYVSLANREIFATQLGSKVHTLEGRKHFSGGDGIQELPEVYDAVHTLLI